MHPMLLTSAILGLCISSLAMPLVKREVWGPVIKSDFPDPSIIRVGDTWYAFGTQSLFDFKDVRVQFATSNDFTTWSLREGYDALGSLGAWVDESNPLVWAPDVFQLDDGSFILYYSATTKTAGDGRFHCIGAARSSNVEGPYESVSDSPLVCPTDQGGAIDASAFRDIDGKRYILYKVDGNAIGNGGECNNGNDPQVPTPIYLQEVDADDGYTFIGDPKFMLDRDSRDGPLIEGPALVRESNGNYVLFFASQCYTSEHYSESYAVSATLKGDYEKARFPLLVTGTPPNVWGPGHADVDWDTQHMAFHGYASKEAVGGRRNMYVATVSYDNKEQTVSLGI
ncbi:hypothetical protein Q7P37_010514 [Cladosporium fusiforme]